MTTVGLGTMRKKERDGYTTVPTHHYLLSTVIVVLFSLVTVTSSSVMLMVTLQVYSPLSDVSRGENERVALSDMTLPDEFSHCTLGAVSRLLAVINLHSTEKFSPAMEMRLRSNTTGFISSGKDKGSLSDLLHH